MPRFITITEKDPVEPTPVRINADQIVRYKELNTGGSVIELANRDRMFSVETPEQLDMILEAAGAYVAPPAAK